MRRHSLYAIATMATMLPGLAHADEVGNAIGEAARAYQAGNNAATRTLLQEALQFLSQRATDKLGAALPPPLAGWQLIDRQPRIAGAASVGGGNQATRWYRNPQGQTVEIRITADSLVLGQLSLVMTNPAISDTMGKAIRVGNQNAIQTSNNEIQMLVNDRILIAVTGSAPIDAKQAFAESIDLTKFAGWR